MSRTGRGPPPGRRCIDTTIVDWNADRPLLSQPKTMNAGQARLIADRWVAEEASKATSRLLGAFTWGSVNWMASEDPFPSTSDVDVVVVPKVDAGHHRVHGTVLLDPEGTLRNDAPEAIATAATERYLSDMAWLRVATLDEARARMLACQPALQPMTDVADEIVSRDSRASV
jgi:hypothetical protein